MEGTDSYSTPEARRVDEVEVWRQDQDEMTLRNTELKDIQQYCKEGTFPPRIRENYGGIVSFRLYFTMAAGPYHEVGDLLNPDECKTMTDLKRYIQDNFERWFGKDVVLEGAILRADDYPNVQVPKCTRINMDDDESWKQWRERNLAYGRRSLIEIVVKVDASQNPQLDGVLVTERDWMIGRGR